MARKSVPKGSEISSVDTVFSKRQRDIQGGGISDSESLTHSSGIKTFLSEKGLQVVSLRGLKMKCRIPLESSKDNPSLK